MRHLLDDPLPDGVYDAAEAAVVCYARAVTRMEPVTDALYGALSACFSTVQIMDICMTVGLSNTINRFHATFQTDIETETTAEAEAGDRIAGTCPIPRPKTPSG